MKASIKFREERKPLVRGKIPLSILGLPFQSGIVAGESKELSLNLGTFFESSPSMKIAYRPNDSLNPFSLVFKTGIGPFGSPISSPMCMSAEFRLIGTQNPSFFIHFKPRLGDFCIKKSQSSDFVKTIKSKSNGAVSDDELSMEVIEMPVMAKNGYSADNGLLAGKKTSVSPAESPVASLIGGILSGAEVSAKTVVPITKRAVVNFRWGLRFPPEEGAAAAVKRSPTAGISFENLPLLVMNKVSIEHVVGDSTKDSNSLRSENLVETCLAVKSQLELIQAENEMLRKAMNDLKSEFAAGKWVLPAGGGDADLGKYRVDRRSNGDKKASEFNGYGGRTTECDMNEELKKKASKDAAGA